MKKTGFVFQAVVLAALAAAAHLCCVSAMGGESVWDGSFWNAGGDAGNQADDEGWGDGGDRSGGAPDTGDIWGLGETAGGPPVLPPGLAALRVKALAGDAGAQYSLGLAYHLGRDGAERDGREAVRWYEMAAERGDTAAMVNAAIILIEELPDDGGEQRRADCAKGHALLQNAAAKGFVNAQHVLGEYYRDGKGVPADPEQAVKWFETAGGNGFGRSCDAASMLHYERGDLENAGKWFLRGAELGNPRSAFNAGVFYENGEGGFPEDADQAFRHFLKAARLGNANGMREVGRYYLRGYARPADPARAKYWLLMARENGHARADELLADVSADIFPFDDRPLRIAAEALIDEFAKDADAAIRKYEDRLVDISGGSTNVTMGGGSTRVVVSGKERAIAIDCDIPRKQASSAVFNYGKGMVLRARFAGFAPDKGVIRLENGETVPEE